MFRWWKTIHLLGTIDARFYGGRAQELGSAFAMRDETGGYYYGAFGGEREGVIASPLLDATIGDEVVTLPASVTAIASESQLILSTNNPYENLTDIAGTDKNVVLNALTVTKNETTTYTRTPNRNWTTRCRYSASNRTYKAWLTLLRRLLLRVVIKVGNAYT